MSSDIYFCHGCFQHWDANRSPDLCKCNKYMVGVVQTTTVYTALPAEWEARTGTKIVDPDGWRIDGKDWHTEITYEEWIWRSGRSTVSIKTVEPAIPGL